MSLILPGAALSAASLVVLAAAATSPAQDQVGRGAAIYVATCASCHGAQLQGGAGPALRNPAVAKVRPVGTLTAATYAKYNRFNMPVSDPGSLTEAQSYAVTAFILSRGGRPVPPQGLSAASAAGMIVRKGGK